MNLLDALSLSSSSSSYGSYGSFGYAAGYVTILTLILTVAVIAMTVVCYHKFVGKKSNPSESLSKFFNFDHLYVENITKALFILSIFGITAFCLFMPLSMLGSRYVTPMSFITTLLGAIILFAVLQIINRLVFEWSMLIIRGAVDLHAVRKKVTGTDHERSNADFAGDMSEIVSSFKKEGAARSAAVKPAAQQPAAPVAPAAPAAPAAPVAPAQPQAADGAWACSCGRAGNTGNFCAACGSPRQ